MLPYAAGKIQKNRGETVRGLYCDAVERAVPGIMVRSWHQGTGGYLWRDC